MTVVNPPPESSTVSPMQGAHIVVADDKVVIQRFVKEALTRAGADVTVVADGQAALDAIEAQIPDLVILDLAMPVMDGWQLLEAMRSDDSLAHVPTLVITAHGQSSLGSALEHMGADGFLGKPFSPTELIRVVTALLESRQESSRPRPPEANAAPEAIA